MRSAACLWLNEDELPLIREALLVFLRQRMEVRGILVRSNLPLLPSDVLANINWDISSLQSLIVEVKKVQENLKKDVDG